MAFKCNANFLEDRWQMFVGLVAHTIHNQIMIMAIWFQMQHTHFIFIYEIPCVCIYMSSWYIFFLIRWCHLYVHVHATSQCRFRLEWKAPKRKIYTNNAYTTLKSSHQMYIDISIPIYIFVLQPTISSLVTEIR